MHASRQVLHSVHSKDEHLTQMLMTISKLKPSQSSKRQSLHHQVYHSQKLCEGKSALESHSMCVPRTGPMRHDQKSQTLTRAPLLAVMSSYLNTMCTLPPQTDFNSPAGAEIMEAALDAVPPPCCHATVP